MAKRIRSTGGQAGDTTIIIEDPGEPGFSDDWSIKIQADDVNAAQTDVDTYAIALAQSDTNAGQTEAVELKFPQGVWADSSATPTEGQSFRVDVWLANSAGAGTGSPANANGQNDGSSATVQTALAGSATETLLSDIGTSTGTWTFTSCLYRGWFSMSTTLATSTCSLIATSNGGLFTDIVMQSHSPALGGTLNHLGGDFTFDLYAAGVDTSAKLNSLQIIHRTTDAVAGATPATVTVDAGRCELQGVFDVVVTNNQLSINDVSVSESTGTITFTVTRANPSGNTDVTFNTAAYTPASGETPAVAGEDYTAIVNQTVSFTGSDTTKNVVVTGANNTYPEPDRKFRGLLSGAVNGSISDSEGIATIQDDEGTFNYLADVSGNGRHLTAGSTLTTSRDAPSGYEKFGKGRAQTGAANERLYIDDDAFNATGDVAVAWIGEWDASPATAEVWPLAFFKDGLTSVAGGAFGLHRVNTGTAQVLRWTQEGTTPNTFDSPTLGAPNITGPALVTARRVGSAIVIKNKGAEVINTTFTGTVTSNAGGRLNIGGRGDGNAVSQTHGAYYVVTIWKDGNVPSQAALDLFAATNGKLKPIGGELAFYRLQDL